MEDNRIAEKTVLLRELIHSCIQSDLTEEDITFTLIQAIYIMLLSKKSEEMSRNLLETVPAILDLMQTKDVTGHNQTLAQIVAKARAARTSTQQ